jgi:hypothetical protein
MEEQRQWFIGKDEENFGLSLASVGNTKVAKQEALNGLKLYPASEGVQVEAALAFVIPGDTPRAESLAQDLGKRFSLDSRCNRFGCLRFRRNWR